MNGPLPPPNRSQTLSPVSTNGSEWSGMNHYDHSHMDALYSPSVASFNRGEVNTGPDAGSYGGLGTSGRNGGYGYGPNPADIPQGRRRPSEGGSVSSSPAVSIANSRSSDGTISDSQSKKYRRMEYELSQHYNILRQYLRGGPLASQRPNKARDKLLRLSPVQFHELSTDVFDELQRRQASTPLPGRPAQRSVPPFLQPKREYHEKRNQARQKLSSLQTSRFRDLSTDVFQELERRFPHFADPTKRPASRAGSRGPGSHAPNGFVPPPRGQSHGHTGSFSQSGRGFGPHKGSTAGVTSFDSTDGNDYGRPMPKQFQSNTITPNKSTMVEDDDGGGSIYDRSSDAFALERALTSPDSNRDTSATSKSGISFQRETEMQQRIDELESEVKDRDDQIRRLGNHSQSNEDGDWSRLKQDLQRRLDDAEQLNRSLRDELDRLHTEQTQMERNLRSQLDSAKSSGGDADVWKTKHDQLEQQNLDLRDQLEQQRHITEEVRQQATEYLKEMRAMADGSGGSWEREEKLHQDVHKLEEEVKEWKARYAKTKTQLRNARASSLGLSIARQDAGHFARDDAFRDEQGLVKDVHITKFQISIDELLRIARSGEPTAVLEYMKPVVFAVRSITQDIDAASPTGKEDEMSKRRLKLKAKVSATANNVITACKNFAAAGGISPVSLLDAAASHLTTAVVELVKTVKIRPTPPGELEDDDEETLEPLQSSGYLNVADVMRRRSAAAESVYSALSTPTGTNRHSGPGPSQHSRAGSRNGYLVNGTGLGRGTDSRLSARHDETELEELKVRLRLSRT